MAKILHLVLKSKWYDKIVRGEKTSEYRECKPYWEKRLSPIWETYSGHPYLDEDEKWIVVFHKGYTSETMEFVIEDCGVTLEPNDLGLDKCWKIKLGQRLK